MNTAFFSHQAQYYTNAVRVTAKLRSRHRRLSDALNNINHPFLLLEEAEIRPLQGSLPWAVTKVDELQLELSAVLFVTQATEGRTPGSDAQGVRVAKDAHPIWVLVPPFCLRGYVHLAAGSRVGDFLLTLPKQFIPVTRAGFCPLADASATTEADFLALNKHSLQAAFPLPPWMVPAQAGKSPEEEMQALLASGVTAVRAGQREEARSYFQRASELSPNSEAVWLWLSSVSDDRAEIVRCMQNVLRINPAHQRAREIVEYARQQPAAPPARPQAQAATPAANPAPASATRAAPAAGPISFLGSRASKQAPANAPKQAPPTEPGRRQEAVPRLGTYLLNAGLLTTPQLQDALAVQTKLAESGMKKRLGEVLIELGYINANAVSAYVREQEREFFLNFRD